MDLLMWKRKKRSVLSLSNENSPEWTRLRFPLIKNPTCSTHHIQTHTHTFPPYTFDINMKTSTRIKRSMSMSLNLIKLMRLTSWILYQQKYLHTIPKSQFTIHKYTLSFFLSFFLSSLTPLTPLTFFNQTKTENVDLRRIFNLNHMEHNNNNNINIKVILFNQ